MIQKSIAAMLPWPVAGQLTTVVLLCMTARSLWALSTAD